MSLFRRKPQEVSIDVAPPDDISAGEQFSRGELGSKIVDALTPETADERIARGPFVSRLQGRAKSPEQLFKAQIMLERINPLILKLGGHPIETDPIEFLRSHSVSLRGGGRKELVKIVAGHPESGKKSLAQSLRRNKEE